MKHSFKKYFLFILTLLALTFSALGSTPALAAGLVVNTATDEDVNNSACSLREAIIAANTDAAYNGCPLGSGADSITFAADYTITLTSQLPQVTTQITITGNGTDKTIIEANASPNIATYRVLYVGGVGSNLTLNNLQIRHGRVTTNPGGGGILNFQGNLTLTNVLVTDNSSTTEVGGGVYNVYSTLTVSNSVFSNNFTGVNGGGIANLAGDIIVTDSEFLSNSATNGGGGISTTYNTGNGDPASASISSSYFGFNTADNGGGLNTEDTNTTITNSTFDTNTATTDGGGLYVGGTATVTNNTFSSNKASNNGAGIINNGGTLALINTIIAGSKGSDNTTDTGADCGNFGTIGTMKNNLIEDTGADACGLVDNVNGNVIGFSAFLGNLDYYGGVTKSFELLTSSKAINGGDNASCPLKDQTGDFRLNADGGQGGTVCDIGSYEVWDTTLPVALIDTKPANPSSSASATFTFSATDNLTVTPNFLYWCELDGAGFTLCGSSTTKTYTGLSAGSHTFDFIARDEAGNDSATVSYTWTVTYPAATTLVNSVLPTSRTVPVGTMATIFNTVVNGGSTMATGVTLSINPAPAGTFVYQQTNCATNAIIGGVDPSLDVAPGGVLCYVLSFTPSATFAATSVHIRAQAANAPSTNLLTGINTWLLRSTAVAGPDIIALTTTTDFHQVACSGANAFAVALSNVGAAAIGDITAVANTGSVSLPLSISISETNPATGVVIGDHILQTVGAGENRTVAVFVTFNGCIAFDPAANRIFIEFRDASNNVVGSTSTAVSTGR